MIRIARFEKVSFEQFSKDWLRNFPGTSAEELQQIYEDIRLPERATAGSAGYDFRTPADFILQPGTEILIPTGIRAKISDGYVLILFPRSSLGFKYRMQLDNTAGVIDADYYGAANEVHIMAKVINDSRTGKVLTAGKGDSFLQGIFLPFGITEDDSADGVRTGGFGSTNNPERG